MIVVPADPAPYDPQRLAGAIPDAQVVNSVGTGATLLISGDTPEDRSDPLSANHEHGAGPPISNTERDAAALEQMTGFLSTSTR